MALILLWPSSTAGPEHDSRPPWVDAQRELEARLRDVSESSRQLMAELEAQPRAAKAPAREPSPQKQLASALVEEDDPRCKPVPAKRHLGGNKLHDKCADRIPNNSFPGRDVFVNGKNFGLFCASSGHPSVDGGSRVRDGGARTGGAAAL
ncbi:DUF6310 domain-containing protein [Archangium sp.]|uniref:DUF6310 domain-containing protein n=1 Tax=Archangium sp. TaxID=1872627 RepID=UPI002D774244|nr:DUF6310 domain-containing protein [Archangium sp.]